MLLCAYGIPNSFQLAFCFVPFTMLGLVKILEYSICMRASSFSFMDELNKRDENTEKKAKEEANTNQ